MNPYDAAFPSGEHECMGMSLRDYFAAKAMQATFSNTESLMVFADAKGTDKNAFSLIASKSYEIADAILKAREESPK